MDCKNLGISLTNKSTSVTPALADDGKNQGEAGNSDLRINGLFFFLFFFSAFAKTNRRKICG